MWRVQLHDRNQLIQCLATYIQAYVHIHTEHSDKKTYGQHKDDRGSECPHSCCITDPAAEKVHIDSRIRMYTYVDGRIANKSYIDANEQHHAYKRPTRSNSLCRTAIVTEPKAKGQSNYRHRDCPAK